MNISRVECKSGCWKLFGPRDPTELFFCFPGRLLFGTTLNVGGNDPRVHAKPHEGMKRWFPNMRTGVGQLRA